MHPDPPSSPSHVTHPAVVFWDRSVHAITAWAGAQQLALRDVVVLLPYAQWLAPARAAWGRAGGWAPRLETLRTLTASLGPSAASPAGLLRLDAALDRLSIAQALQRLPQAPWAPLAEGGVAHAAKHAVDRVLQAASALARAAHALPPGQRKAYWEQARQQLPALGGPGAAERSLARWALEWAAAAAEPASDALFRLRPAGWVLLQGAEAQPLAEQVAQASGRPTLRLDASEPTIWTQACQRTAAGAAAEAGELLQLAACTDFEDEAQATAAQVLQHLKCDEVPVALVAQDRELVRRVRALLARHAVPIDDETGWLLTTTRAGAAVMCLLRAASPQASSAEVLEALRGARQSAATEAALDALEDALRRGRHSRASQVPDAALPQQARPLWQHAQQCRRTLAGDGMRSLAAWLGVLRQHLEAEVELADPQQPDEAMRQVYAALHLHDSDLHEPGVTGAPAREDESSALAVMELPDVELDLPAFTAWVDAALEQAVFRPAPPPEAAVQVVITPLSRVGLRPFAAVVMPGCDARRLAPAGDGDALLGDALAARLGLPHRVQRRAELQRAFELLLQQPRLTLLRRHAEQGEELAAAPWWERLQAEHQRLFGRPLPAWRDPRAWSELMPQQTRRPSPVPLRLPQRLSASRVADLRACPYRFFSRAVLGLSQSDELEDDADKRDYGLWLHAVLDAFHRERTPGAEAAADAALLQRVAQRCRRERALDDAGFLPFAASFESLAPLYLAWLRQREAHGWHWQQGELPCTATSAALGGVQLYGRLDRLDGGPGRQTQVIDYKTSSSGSLKKLVKQPLEDTQLAFYAALWLAADAAQPSAQPPLAAMYLALDSKDGLVELPHPQVTESAERLVQGLAGELQRLREGAGLPALGEGLACEHCEARGLCRKDQWEGRP
jgi:ATP-dependent helicase/nuclease subunit B